jgi:hypothetical protein
MLNASAELWHWKRLPDVNGTLKFDESKCWRRKPDFFSLLWEYAIRVAPRISAFIDLPILLT